MKAPDRHGPRTEIGGLAPGPTFIAVNMISRVLSV